MATDRKDLIGADPSASKFDSSYIGRVRDMRYLGASDGDIALMIGVTKATLKNWQENYPEFKAAWDEGGAEADAKVAAALYKRAVGYSYVSSRKIDSEGNVTENVSHVKPDVTAATKWLAVRQPDKWGKLLSGEGGTAPGNSIGAGIGQALLSDVEVGRRLAFLLAKAVQESQDKSVTIDGSIEHDSERPDSPETK